MQIPDSDNHPLVCEAFEKVDDSDVRSWLQGPLIAFNRDRDLLLSGTAFMIAPGWAMTAKHVVTDYLASIGGIDVERSSGIKADFNFDIRLTLTDKEKQPFVAIVSNIYYNGLSDVALLRVQNQSDRPWESFGEFPTLQFMPPKVGESISIIGCPHSYLVHGEDGVREVHTFPRISTGTVREVHEMRRDWSLNFPCFHTSARVLGRMSGSPIFNDNGYICGVAVYSMQQDESLEPISYGASLWPTTAIQCDKEPSITDDFVRMFDLVHRGQIKAADIDKVLVARDINDKWRVVNLEMAEREGWKPEDHMIRPPGGH